MRLLDCLQKISQGFVHREVLALLKWLLVDFINLSLFIVDIRVSLETDLYSRWMDDSARAITSRNVGQSLGKVGF